jgi:hypothetical protein
VAAPSPASELRVVLRFGVPHPLGLIFQRVRVLTLLSMNGVERECALSKMKHRPELTRDSARRNILSAVNVVEVEVPGIDTLRNHVIGEENLKQNDRAAGRVARAVSSLDQR